MAMRTKVKPKKAATKKPKASSSGNGHAKSVLDVPVEFGGVSIGDKTCRLGVTINRGTLNLNAADEAFCGHRLTGRIELGTNGDSPGQAHLFDVTESLDGTFDCKNLSVTSSHIGVGLTFNKSDCDISGLAQFAKGSGRLIVETVTELPEGAADDDDASDPPILKAAGDWALVPIDTLFSGALLKSLKKAGLETVGALADYTGADKRLIDLDGIGEGKAAQVEERMLKFWEANPDAGK